MVSHSTPEYFDFPKSAFSSTNTSKHWPSSSTIVSLHSRVWFSRAHQFRRLLIIFLSTNISKHYWFFSSTVVFPSTIDFSWVLQSSQALLVFLSTLAFSSIIGFIEHWHSPEYCWFVEELLVLLNTTNLFDHLISGNTAQQPQKDVW